MEEGAGLSLFSTTALTSFFSGGGYMRRGARPQTRRVSLLACGRKRRKKMKSFRKHYGERRQQQRGRNFIIYIKGEKRCRGSEAEWINISLLVLRTGAGE